jgi:superfamily I DNA/RNA helicase
MTEPSPNDRQEDLIEGTEGLYLVDAGPGTGKTFAITRRYGTIVDQPDVEPEDILLVTFTRSAAAEMKERIVDHSSYGLRELADAPIQTFHSHCHDILREHGYAAPTHLGLDERITGSTQIIDDELIETERFREFFSGFRDDHLEYAEFYRILSEPDELLDLIKELASKGIFPTVDGWYRDGESHLDGDFEAFKERFDAVNQPRNDGRKRSELRDDLSRFGRNKTYLSDAPSKSELRGGRGTKQLDDDAASDVFYEEREDLKAFVHDVYIEYLQFVLGRNYLNFGFLQLFAFVLLCEDHSLRDRIAFDYVMVDEFQDTSEIQFKLALLLTVTDNLCVVGDWKQSIYSFQYADVENIVEFDERLERFTNDLNQEVDRVSLDPTDFNRIELEENYRSTQTILDFSESALVTPATSKDEVDDTVLDDVVSLSSNASFDESVIEGVKYEDEHEAVLAVVQRMVGTEDYIVEDENEDRRPPSFGDIAVLTRTRDYGRELLDVAEQYSIPMAYDGGIELFRTDPAKLLLAWLRILERDADRGWAVVLERAGYTLDEVDHVLSTGDYPTDMVAFHDRLAEMGAVGSIARCVFDRYDFNGDHVDVILHTIQSIHDSTTMTRGELIRFIGRAIEDGSTHDVQTNAGDDSVTVQTIHAAKGREYPIVILANMNDGCFPPSTRNSNVIRYDEPVGLRQRKEDANVHQHPHVYDNWRYDVYRHCLPREYDEERRLLYVAMTRAEHHLVFAGGEEPNTFLEELPVDVGTESIDLEAVDQTDTVQAQLPFTVATPDGPDGETPHSLMDDSVFEAVDGEKEATGGRGTGFGADLHEFAEDYANGFDVTPSNADERRVKEFLDGLDGELFVEEWARLPLVVGGEQATISGIVDLVHVTPERVEIVDYKTDVSRRAEPEYRKQLSVYYHVLTSVYDDRGVTAKIYYTADDEVISVSPMSLEELQELVLRSRE